MANGSHDLIVDTLAGLGVSTLKNYVSEDQLNSLDALGVQIGANTIADLMASNHGVDVFSDGELRLHILTGMEAAVLAEFLNYQGRELGDKLVKYNRFSWGDNPKSRQFLDLLGIDASSLEREAVDLSASFDLGVDPYPLHPYQNWLRKQVVNELSHGSADRFLLHMPTGSGKTRTSLESLIDHVRSLEDTNVTIVWFAHSEELCEQASESIQNLWARLGSEPAQLIKMWGGRPSVELAKKGPIFVVTSFQTAFRSLTTRNNERFRQFAEIRRKCKVLVVDEAHQSTAPTYREAIQLFTNRSTKVLGLTATPGRHHINQLDEETVELAEFYSGRKITIVGNGGESLDNPIQFLTETGILSTVDTYQLNSRQDFGLSETERKHIEQQLEIPSSFLKKIGENSARTNLIATHAIKLVREQSASIIIFAPSKDNAVQLAQLLSFQGVEARSVTGDSSAYSRKEAIDSFSSGKVKVITNFGVLTTGFDAPNIDTVIVARPTTSVVLYSQMIGRGLRGPAMGGTERCKIIDVIDNVTQMPEVDEAFVFFNDFYQ